MSGNETAPTPATAPDPGRTAVPGAASNADRAAALDLTVARLLSRGTMSSVALLAIGVVLLAAAGRSPLDTEFAPLDLARLPSDLVALRPEGFLWLGLVAVILTPISRVIASLGGFWRAKDLRMVVISVAILGVIAASIALTIVLK